MRRNGLYKRVNGLTEKGNALLMSRKKWKMGMTLRTAWDLKNTCWNAKLCRENTFHTPNVKDSTRTNIHKKLKFNDHVQIILIPYEERKGIWMKYAIIRAHFKKRIQQTEDVLLPMLLQKLKTCALNSETQNPTHIDHNWGHNREGSTQSGSVHSQGKYTVKGEYTVIDPRD